MHEELAIKETEFNGYLYNYKSEIRNRFPFISNWKINTAITKAEKLELLEKKKDHVIINVDNMRKLYN